MRSRLAGRLLAGVGLGAACVVGLPAAAGASAGSATAPHAPGPAIGSVATWNPLLTPPPARFGASSAFDSTSQQLLLFGGQSATSADNDLWSYDQQSARWTQVLTNGCPGCPPARQGAGMADDPGGKDAILFGGVRSDGSFHNDTWSWNGASWAQLTTTGSPPALLDPSMAYDPASQQVLLFGGKNSGGAELAETWVYDPASKAWSQPTLSGQSPPARSGAAMAWDPQTHQLVMFGGLSGSGGYLDDTWIWNGSTHAWSEACVTGCTPPSARWLPSLAYDGGSTDLVLFGGSSSPPSGLDDTWAWDGTTWTQEHPAVHPAARYYATMADDPAGRPVLFGGEQGGSIGYDTWVWSGLSGTWTEVAQAPPPRSQASMAYDGRQLVAFGGTAPQVTFDDTWTFDGSTWTEQAPAKSPAARSDAATAFDPATGQVVAYGGFTGSGAALGDTWAWDGSTDQWSEPCASDCGPPALGGASMAYDAATGQLLLFGGYDGANFHDDAYAWTGSAWSLLPVPGNLPSPRSDASMAYDATAGQVVLFGGVGSAATLDDTWTFDGSAWTERAPAKSPTARSDAASAYQPTFQAVVLFGGFTSSGGSLGDTWAWDGSAQSWVQQFPVASPAARGGARMAYDQAADQTVLFGGNTTGAATFFNDTWSLAGVPPPPPTVTAVAPAGGSAAGGTGVTITGTGFAEAPGATTFDFGAGNPASGVSCTSSTTCSATTPPGTGTVDVLATVGGQTSPPNPPGDQFTYGAPPAVTSVSPQAGSSAGGTAITVTGTGFTTGGTTSVDVGGHAATGVSCASTTTCTATTPPGTGLADVVVTTPLGSSQTTPSDHFAYVSPTGRYYPLVPYRILDTRNGTGHGGPIGPDAFVDVQVTGTGSGADSVPAGAKAVVLNVTEADATAGSYLTVWPAGQPPPTASNLNFGPGQVVPNLVEVGLPSSGQVSIYNNQGLTDVVADVEGYVGDATAGTSTTGQFDATSPARILDTRTTLGGHEGPLGPGQTLRLQVAEAQGVVPDSGAGAVVLNVTVTDTTAPSYLTVWPTGARQPLASNLNFSPGQTVPNRVMVPLGTGGQISIFNASGYTNVIADVGGWFTDGSIATATGDHFTPAGAPVRILDTRDGTGAPEAPIGPGSSIKLTATSPPSPVPADADAVVANFTVTDTTASSYLTVYPGDETSVPTISDLNWSPGSTIANLVVAKLGDQGWNVYNNSGTTNAIADVAGWYSP